MYEHYTVRLRRPKIHEDSIISGRLHPVGIHPTESLAICQTTMPSECLLSCEFDGNNNNNKKDINLNLCSFCIFNHGLLMPNNKFEFYMLVGSLL